MSIPVDAKFPTRRWALGRPLWRVHRAERGPWWFSGDGSGRFDPVGQSGLGACYLAQEPLGAFVEVFRTGMELDVEDVERRLLARLTPAAEVALADLCSRRAASYGVTAQLGAGGDFAVSQEFASRAAQVGFGGVRWWVRHDAAQKLVGVALFAAAGTRDDDAHWPAGVSKPLDEQLLASARRTFGYRVLPRP